jgi:hypothetical protein
MGRTSYMCWGKQKNPISLMGICVLYRRDPYPLSSRKAPASSSSVWKTEILLLNDWRMKGKAAGVGIAPIFPVLQTGANLSQLSSESGACDRCCSDFIFRSTGERPCCWTSHAKWPATVSRRALSLKRRLHHCNACRPKVLQSELASASRSYQDRALLHELQEGKWWTRR